MKGLLFTYALTYGGAVVSLVNPFYGLLIYICFAIIRPEHLWHWSLPRGGHLSRIVAIGLLVGWGMHGFGNWRFGRGRAPVLALVGFWLWAVISALFAASDTQLAWRFIESMGKIVLPFVVGMTLVDSRQKLKQLAWVILLSQGYLAWELNLSYLEGFNQLHTPYGTGGFGGMDNNCVAVAMVAGAGLAFFLGMHEEGWRRWLGFACAGLMAHAIMFAFSRGGMLGLILTGVVSFLLIDKKPKHFAYFALAVVIGLHLAGREVRDRFWSAFADPEERDASAQSRVQMWQNCWQIMMAKPILGVGPDHWPLMASRYGWPEGKEAHSLWFQTGAEMGLTGVGLLLAFYLIPARRLWPIARRNAGDLCEWDVAVGRMYIAALTGFAISAQFVSLEGLELPYYITLIGTGTLKMCSLGAAQPALGSGATDDPDTRAPLAGTATTPVKL